MQNFKYSLVFIFFIHFCMNSWGQAKNSLIVYHTFFGEDESFKSLGKNAIDQYKQEVEQQEFQLIFNDSLSHFHTIKTMELQLSIINIYKRISDDIAYKPLKEEKVLLKLPRNQIWQFSNEKKKIGSFTCYKATSSYSITRGDKTINFPIIAWFTPEIPFGFGPMGYGGFPGIILELQVRNITYGAKKVILKTVDQAIVFPNKNDYEVMTEQDWEAMILKRMQDE